jgi:hypothetical protein
MQYLDNDMDELFSKAGNDYPLRTDVPDFDALAGKLNPVVDNKTNYRKYLLLLLLLPVGYLIVDNSIGRTAKNPPAVKPSSVISNTPFSKGGEQSPQAITANKASQSITPNESPQAITANKASQSITANESAQSIVLNKASKSGSIKNKELMVTQLLHNSRAVSPFEKGGSFDEVETGDFSQNQHSHLSHNTFFKLPKLNSSYPKPLISFPNLSISSTPSAPEKKSTHKSSIYIGAIAGPDFSTVKYQSIKNVGFSIGILAGYTFSKKWSVETGFIFNNKKYYTDGKYFDKTKSGIPPAVYVESLDGSCNMFEVPVSVRYDFSTNKNRFFATFGATSYFMKKEKYTYDANASGNYYKGHRSYDNSGNHLFSNMQFSLGYNKQLSNKTNLRVEPYIKVPVRDIGIGKMPLTSSGIYFSVIQRIK